MNSAIFSLSAIFAAAAAVVLSGCVIAEGEEGLLITDDPCISACEGHADTCGVDFDCEAVCDMVSEERCEDEYVDHKSCLDDAGVCGDPNVCVEQGDALSACLDNDEA